jgi:alanyl-tRNA synthetase
MGFLGLGGGKKAAKIQAAATIKSAEMQAGSDRLTAQAAQSAQETMLAQTRASERASEILSVPQEKVDVQLATDATPSEIDPGTGRRKTARSPFMAQGQASAGVRL